MEDDRGLLGFGLACKKIFFSELYGIGDDRKDLSMKKIF